MPIKDTEWSFGEVYIDGVCIGTAKDIYIESFEPDHEAVADYVRTLTPVWDDYTLTFDIKPIKYITMLKLIGLWKWVADNCPNKRIVHLMNYGKSARIRMKNYNRAIQEIGKHIMEDKT